MRADPTAKSGHSQGRFIRVINTCPWNRQLTLAVFANWNAPVFCAFIFLSVAAHHLWGIEHAPGASVSGKIDGQITDFRLNPAGVALATNRLAFSGIYRDGCFRVDITPIAAEDDIQESAAWESCLYLVQRFPSEPGKGLPRDKSIGYIEPTIFSRYSTHATAALLMALADHNAVVALTNAGGHPILLGTIRQYPEEASAFSLNYSSFGNWSASAVCPGLVVGRDNKLTPLDSPVYADGFLRWRFRTEVTDRSDVALATRFVYERFRPKYAAQKPTGRDDLIKDRHIEGNLRLEYSAVDVPSFRPEITEPSLMVLDFRGRRDFVKASGNYEKDYCVQHILTNQSWSLDDRDAIKSIGRMELGIQVMAERRERYASYRWVFFVGFAVVSAFLLLIALKWNAGKLKAQRQKK
jgi:hypothetical protein